MTTTLLGPTRERLAKCADFEVPLTDTRRRRQSFRIVDVVEVMWRAGKLRDHQLAAFKLFEQDLAYVFSSGRLLCRYGDGGGGGTPLSQQLGDLSVEEKQSDAHRRVASASRVIGEPCTVEALVMVAVQGSTLEDIGRVVLLIRNRPQAKAAAERTVQIGTYSLAQAYGCLTVPITPS